MDPYSFFTAFLGLIALEAVIKLMDAISEARRRAVEAFVREAKRERVNRELIRRVEEKWLLR